MFLRKVKDAGPATGHKAAGHKRSPIVWLVVVAVLAAVGAAGWKWWRPEKEPSAYSTAMVSRGDIERTVTMTGAINPVTTVQVGSYVSGTIKTLLCDFNTEVKVGQICGKIDPQPFLVVVDQDTANLQTARAQLKKDQAAQAYTKLNYERDRKLLAQGVVSQDAVDNDKSAYDQGAAQVALDEASIREREAELKAAQVNLQFTDIISPVDGTVITRNVDVGQTVASSLQTPTLFLIAKDLSKMQVDTNVSEADISAVRVGQKVYFTVQAYPDREFWGTVSQIRRGPVTVQNVVTYDVVVAVDNPDLVLLPGMTADTHIITDARRDVLRVPLAATRFTPHDHGRRNVDGEGDGRREGHHQNAGEEGRGGHPGGSAGHHHRLWVLRNDHLTPVAISIGLDDGSQVEVSAPDLKPGDLVAVGAQRPQEGKPGQPGPSPLRRQWLRF